MQIIIIYMIIYYTNLLLNFFTTRLLNLLVSWPELDPTFLVAEVVAVACSVGGRPAQSIHIPYCVWQAYCTVAIPKISTIIFLIFNFLLRYAYIGASTTCSKIH